MNKNKAILAVSDVQGAPVKSEQYIFVTEFNTSSAEKFYSEFLKLQGDPSVNIIPIIVNSYGGDVYALLSMLDLIESSNKPVATIASGKAMSCGSVLVSAGTPGLRYAAPNVDIMIHEAGSVAWGKATEIEASTKQLKRLNKKLLSKLSEYAKNKDKNFFVKQIQKRTNLDWYLTAQEAKKLGLIDHVGVPQIVKQ